MPADKLSTDDRAKWTQSLATRKVKQCNEFISNGFACQRLQLRLKTLLICSNYYCVHVIIEQRMTMHTSHWSAKSYLLIELSLFNVNSLAKDRWRQKTVNDTLVFHSNLMKPLLFFLLFIFECNSNAFVDINHYYSSRCLSFIYWYVFSIWNISTIPYWQFSFPIFVNESRWWEKNEYKKRVG